MTDPNGSVSAGRGRQKLARSGHPATSASGLLQLVTTVRDQQKRLFGLFDVKFAKFSDFPLAWLIGMMAN